MVPMSQVLHFAVKCFLGYSKESTSWATRKIMVKKNIDTTITSTTMKASNGKTFYTDPNEVLFKHVFGCLYPLVA